jgi:hypothetical protein
MRMTDSWSDRNPEFGTSAEKKVNSCFVSPLSSCSLVILLKSHSMPPKQQKGVPPLLLLTAHYIADNISKFPEEQTQYIPDDVKVCVVFFFVLVCARFNHNTYFFHRQCRNLFFLVR